MSSLLAARQGARWLAVLRASMSAVAGSKGEVAVVGAGLAGLVCASELADQGYQVTVFDLGRAYPGGRSATRRMKWDELQFDHGCQFMKPLRSEVVQTMTQWEQQGLVSKWNARLGELDAKTGRLTLQSEGSSADAPTSDKGGFFDISAPGEVYVPHGSMDAICSKLLTNPKLKRVSLSTQVQRVGQDTDGKWVLEGMIAKPRAGPADLKDLPPRSPWNLGVFDALVLASIMPMTPGSPAHIDFTQAPRAVSAVQQLSQVQSDPLVSLMVAFPPASIPMLPFDAVSLTNSSKISWICNSSSKPGQQREDRVQCWVAVTCPEFAKELIGSTRPLPPQTPEYCTQLAQPIWDALLDVLKPILGDQVLPEPIILTSHRWGAALPSNPLRVACLRDSKSGLVAAGDFCSGAGVDNTIYSGLAASRAVQDMLD